MEQKRTVAVYDCISWGLQIINAVAFRVTKFLLLLFALFCFSVKGYQSSSHIHIFLKHCFGSQNVCALKGFGIIV